MGLCVVGSERGGLWWACSILSSRKNDRPSIEGLAPAALISHMHFAKTPVTAEGRAGRREWGQTAVGSRCNSQVTGGLAASLGGS